MPTTRCRSCPRGATIGETAAPAYRASLPPRGHHILKAPLQSAPRQARPRCFNHCESPVHSHASGSLWMRYRSAKCYPGPTEASRHLCRVWDHCNMTRITIGGFPPDKARRPDRAASRGVPTYIAPVMPPPLGSTRLAIAGVDDDKDAFLHGHGGIFHPSAPVDPRGSHIAMPVTARNRQERKLTNNPP